MIDIDKQIAEQVIGWQLDQSGHYWWKDNPHRPEADKHHFKPSTNISDASLMEEALMEKGLTCEYIDALIEVTNILVFDSDKSKQVANYRLSSAVIFLLVHATPEQRCLAALEVVK